MNILLIGHKGYLGTGLFKYLSKNHKIIGWDKEEDLFNLTTSILIKEKIDVVLNFSVAADRQSTIFMIDSPTDLVNVQGSHHLAHILKGTDVGWFHISTREVFKTAYGHKDITHTKQGYRPKYLVDEEFEISPPNCYGKSKLMGEFISESHPKSNVIRLSTCYTDFDHMWGNWIVKMIKSALQGKTVSLAGGGLQFRDPLHINDLGHLIELLIYKNIWGKKINAGGGDKNLISLDEFIRTAIPHVQTEESPGGDYGFAFNNNKAENLTGWKPKVLFRERIPIIVKNISQRISK